MKLLEAMKQINECREKTNELQAQISNARFNQKKEHYSYGFYIDNGTIKIYIANKHGYRATFYYSTIKEIIKDLKLLDKIIKEAELKKEKENTNSKEKKASK